MSARLSRVTRGKKSRPPALRAVGERENCAPVPGAGRSGASLYDEVTARIVREMEAGRFPWVQPWAASSGGAGVSLPRNAVTGRCYSGVNILLLWGAVIDGAWPSQGWLTFKQALAAGGCVRKGERGTTIVYADRFIPKDENERIERSRDGGENEPRRRAVPFLKRFTVFNVAQCDGLGEGLKSNLAADPVPLRLREIVAVGEEIIAASGADFRVGGDRAFYSVGHDFVAVPPQPLFHDQINYYRTALHELTHWTGNVQRLGRDQTGGFGSEAYAREELAAEMGSAFSLRRARYRAHRSPCRLSRRMAPRAAHRQSRDLPRRLCRVESSRLSARVP
jgi:antirestriction protein ArdC